MGHFYQLASLLARIVLHSGEKDASYVTLMAYRGVEGALYETYQCQLQ